MEAAEGEAIVILHAAVGDVQRVQRGRDSFAEILAEREIERGVLGQIVAGIRLVRKGVAESRTVIDVRGNIGTPGKRDVAADVERVPLVMVERVLNRREREIGETTVMVPLPSAI